MFVCLLALKMSFVELQMYAIIIIIIILLLSFVFMYILGSDLIVES